MDPGSSLGSFSDQHVPSKVVPGPGPEFELERFEPTRASRHRWYSSTNSRLASKAPRLHERVFRVITYIRGPKPKVDLPGTNTSTDVVCHFC